MSDRNQDFGDERLIRIVAEGSSFDSSPSQSLQISMGPIETEMRAKLNTLKDTKYPDTFDWGVYDKIAARFDEEPRGGVVFKTGLKLVNYHSSCSKCHYAFEIDTYGRGCFHDCGYCYAKETLSGHGYWNRPQPFPVDLAEVRKIFYTVFETNRPSKWREVMEKRVPLRMGSMSDSFMWLDTKYGVTKELLKIFKFYRYPYVIFTRSDLVAHDDYMSLLDINLCSVQFSIAGNNNSFIRTIEPGAPSYKRRLAALRKLSDAGFWTTVRINPLFPKYPDGYFTDPDSLTDRFKSRDQAPILPFYDQDFIAELADTGTPSILAGFVRLSTQSINNMSKTSGIDIKSFYKPELWEQRGHKRYSDEEIAYYYKWVQQECKKHKVRFNTCYIGNGIKDYYQYQDLWDNKKDCCDVIGNVKSFKTTSQSINWDERTRHAANKCMVDESKKAEMEADSVFAEPRPSKVSRIKEPELSL
jgi:DNA repair photolyase